MFKYFSLKRKYKYKNYFFSIKAKTTFTRSRRVMVIKKTMYVWKIYY